MGHAYRTTTVCERCEQARVAKEEEQRLQAERQRHLADYKRAERRETLICILIVLAVVAVIAGIGALIGWAFGSPVSGAIGAVVLVFVLVLCGL